MSAWRDLPKDLFVRDHHHEVRLDTEIIFMYNMSGWFLGFRMLLTGTFLSLASASSVVQVRDHHHEVGLDMGIIFTYNMSI